MNNFNRKLPSISAMMALECVAHFGNVTRAAEELNTSQSAVSRHLRQLEADLGVALVARDGRGIVLTTVGQVYAQDVSKVLSKLRQAGNRAQTNNFEITIACTHEVSHLILMPRYGDLKKALGQQAHIRVVTCEYGALPAVIDAGADIVFEYRRSPPHRPSATITHEEIIPAAAPDFIERNRVELNKHPSQWGGITRLSLTKPNSGWASWPDWFEAQGTIPPQAPNQMFDNYVYALEAATRGEGLVLAWRGFVDHYLNSGQLVPLEFNRLKSGATLFAVSTASGSNKKLTKRCIKALSGNTQ